MQYRYLACNASGHDGHSAADVLTCQSHPSHRPCTLRCAHRCSVELCGPIRISDTKLSANREKRALERYVLGCSPCQRQTFLRKRNRLYRAACLSPALPPCAYSSHIKRTAALYVTVVPVSFIVRTIGEGTAATAMPYGATQQLPNVLSRIRRCTSAHELTTDSCQKVCAFVVLINKVLGNGPSVRSCAMQQAATVLASEESVVAGACL